MSSEGRWQLTKILVHMQPAEAAERLMQRNQQQKWSSPSMTQADKTLV